MKPLNAEVHLSRVSEVFFSGKREEARLDYQPLFGKMSPHSSPRIKDRTRETAEIEPKKKQEKAFSHFPEKKNLWHRGLRSIQLLNETDWFLFAGSLMQRC